MKKVLILTTSTGQGHNQAANSLIEAFKDTEFECIKHDFLGSDNKLINKIVVWSYEFSASTFPHIYGFFYKLTDNKYINRLASIFFLSVALKLSKFIKKEKPDLIIGTHPFTVNIIDMLKRWGMSTPFMAVVTDFKAHYTYISPLVDAYITGSKSTKNYLISERINPDIIYPLGIPIKESFYESDLNISHVKDKEYFSLLLMSGSMGLNNISYVLDELLKNKHKLRITVVCGKNEKLQKSLLNKCEKDYPGKKVYILGFSNDIASFMEYSDIIISKPGGLTVTEAIIKNLPLIIPFVIPGQEMDNARFLESNGYAFYINDFKSINPLVDKLIENPKYLEDMRKNLKELSSCYSNKKIIDIATNLITKNHP
jgi:processive 1,2-diacylglycerol beta-glucosyltransferase